MRRFTSKILSLVLIAFMIVSVAPIVNYANAGGAYNLTVTPGCGYNMLEWDAIPGAAHYWIYRGYGPGQEFSTPLTDFPISETEFKDTINIENGTLYCYFVKAVNSDAEEFATTIEGCATPRCYDDDDCKLVLKYQQDNVQYWVNDVEKGPMDTPPVNVNARLFLVVRYVTQEIPGTTIDWDAATKTVIVKTADGTTIELQIGNKDAKVNGQVIQIDPNNPEVVPFISEGRTLCPMRFVAENLGATGPNDIKWYGDTKIVELRFDDPECDECEWVRGKIINSIYNEGSTELTHATLPHYEVEIEDCGGNLHIFYARGDNPDETGKYYISDAIGLCVEVCISEGIIQKWKVAEEPCCDEVIEPKCIEMEGEIMYTIFDTMTEKWEVKFKKCDETYETYHAESDLTYRNYNLSEYEGCAMICVLNGIIQYWEPHPDMDDCCGEETEKDCICIEIIRINCDVDQPFILAKLGNNGMIVTIPVPYYICAKISEAGGIGTCWEVCGKISRTDTSTINVEDIELRPVECPCGGVAEPMPCICVEVVDPTNDSIYAEDADGNMWVLTFKDPDHLTKMSEGGCWNVCGEIIPPTSTNDSLTKKMEVEKIAEAECPCKARLFCICLTIKEVTPNGVTGVDATGGAWTLTTSSADIDLTNMEVGDCWKVCGTVIAPTATAATNLRRLDVATMEKVECPCGGPAIKEVCMCFTVERTACDSDQPMVYGSDENGNKWVLVLDDPDVCKEMEIGTCWQLCGNHYGNSQGNFRVLRDINAEPVDCPCVPENEICTCVEIVRTACDGDVPMVYGKDENGMMWVLYPENDNMCGAMKIGTCWSVCGNAAGFVGNNKVIKVTWGEQVECPCGEGECDVHLKGVIKYLGCKEDDKIILEVLGDEVEFLSDNARVCNGFEIGDCVLACIVKGENGENTILWMKKIDPAECNSRKHCVCVEVVKSNCEGDIGKVYVKDSNGNSWLILLDKNHDGICEKMTSGTCWYVCGYTTEDEEAEYKGLRVEYIDQVDCPCGDNDPEKEICICATVIKANCDSKTPFVYVRGEKGRKWVVYTDNADIDCEKLEEGSCWTICGEPAVGVDGIEGIKITYIERVDCPCLSEEITLCVTVEDPACHGDMPRVYARRPNDESIVLYFDDSYECETMMQGECWEVHGSWFFDETTGATGFKVASMEKVGCPCGGGNEDSKEFDMIIYERHCDTRMPYFVATYRGYLYNVYLPEGFDCNPEIFYIYQCIKVKGTLNGRNIRAANVEKRDCGQLSLLGCTVVNTYCDEGYMEVTYGPTHYKFYYPPYFDCSSVNAGDCLTFRGMIYTTGIIKEVEIVKVTPCN